MRTYQLCAVLPLLIRLCAVIPASLGYRFFSKTAPGDFSKRSLLERAFLSCEDAPRCHVPVPHIPARFESGSGLPEDNTSGDVAGLSLLSAVLYTTRKSLVPVDISEA